jgi:hypothetical protein
VMTHWQLSAAAGTLRDISKHSKRKKKK